MAWLDWVELAVRWFHVVAGVAWIGASFYFIWLDNNLETPPQWKQDKGIKGDLWAVHGGGFYEVAKYRYGPEKMPETLHWFKWEAYTTWISGMLMLSLVYYLGASAYLIDPNVMAMEPAQAITYSLLYIFGGLALYEAACRSPLRHNAMAFAIILAIVLAGFAWGAAQLFSARAAYIHFGALLGTIMAANVFTTIMPGQRKMVAAVTAKQEINPEWGENAKLRSVHNNYFTLPLLFTMISNHYPMTYQHEHGWIILVLISVVLAWVRHYFNLKHQGVKKPSILITGALGFIAIAAWATWPQVSPTSNKQTGNEVAVANLPTVTQEQVVALMDKHCVSCHAAKPTDSMFPVAPVGVKLDSWELITQWQTKIYQRVSITKDMPFLNKSQMTQEERALIATWYRQNQQ